MKAFPVVDRMLSFKPASFSWAPVSVTDAPRCCGSIKSIQPNSPSLPQRGTHNWAQIAIDMLKIRKSCRFNPSPNCIYIYIYIRQLCGIFLAGCLRTFSCFWLVRIVAISLVVTKQSRWWKLSVWSALFSHSASMVSTNLATVRGVITVTGSCSRGYTLRTTTVGCTL